MNIIAHRGCWKIKGEQNTLQAFKKAFEMGFGVETDFRDLSGQLVISHDLPSHGNFIHIEQFIDLYCDFKKNDIVLAINIKSDGLQKLVEDFIKTGKIENYFVFDMSFPDMRLYARDNINFYTRISDLEPLSLMSNQGSGFWVDAFEEDWINHELINRLINEGKNVALVSPELHGRSYEEFWSFIKVNSLHKNPMLALCTDHPELARNFFYG